MHAVQLRLARRQSPILPPDAYELACKGARLLRCLFGLRWVSLRSLGCLEDVGFGFGLEASELLDVAVKLSDVGAHKCVAFSFLFFFV